MPNQPKTPGHTIRVPDDEWIPARDKATRKGETMTDVIRRGLRRYVVNALAVACFIGGGYLAVGYFQPSPTVDNSVWKNQHQQQVWKDLQQRRDQLQRDLQQQRPAPTPAPTTHDTERSI